MFRNLRVLLCLITIYLGLALTAAFFIDLLICFPISDNWSLDYDKQGRSIWNSYTDFGLEWMLNFSTDVFRTFGPRSSGLLESVISLSRALLEMSL